MHIICVYDGPFYPSLVYTHTANSNDVLPSLLLLLLVAVVFCSQPLRQFSMVYVCVYCEQYHFTVQHSGTGGVTKFVPAKIHKYSGCIHFFHSALFVNGLSGCE